ncbi:Glycosyltransferase involved in cell wall bisynthesis [Actinopolyspora xinjiangensis]|uniref:Glycosyltransferase involved in cell wall bisynthesis n=1 Tax=Actinopolyspora xinjiangensis TaxID=405564 RepID=A0A1H0SXT5_9ACTN|nr:glycosyltransferase [Actinopolyspora xinjiangensis]SDP46692.1 Glycosyltransferase involved in cell wall bisynthesis [Actinopolyspora xinjiangensis]
MRIAMFGTRGVPARYGGFETCVEEVGKRLVRLGHEVTVYCRDGNDLERSTEHLGMKLVRLPAVRRKTLETLSHTGVSVGHALPNPPDVAVVFNAANAPFLPLLRARGVPVVTHVDGLEWKRAKWGKVGSRYYRAAEAAAVRWSDALIADSRGIQEYYAERFGIKTEYIPYGAPVLDTVGADTLAEHGLRAGEYHLVVARFEPENHVDVAVAGYNRSGAVRPLVVVGEAPYSDAYTARVRGLASRGAGVRLLGAVWDQRALDQLYANALTYVHGHSVGGTNPSLLRAMGAATAVSAFDVPFNREVLGEYGAYFTDPASLAECFDRAEERPQDTVDRGRGQLAELRHNYDWDAVARDYAELAERLRVSRGSPSTGRASRLFGREAAGRGQAWRSQPDREE